MTRSMKFERVPRKLSAKKLVPIIRRSSKKFKYQLSSGNTEGMRVISTVAWDAMIKLFDILRNEQDQHRLDDMPMQSETAFVVDRVSSAEQTRMIADRKIDKRHPGYGPISLRETLNKIAHFDTQTASFRVDGRGAHYLILGGQRRGGGYWVTEILVSKLCKKASAAIRVMR